jgi:hypothetical protein
MTKDLTPYEKLILENAMLRLDFHSFVMAAKKLVDSSKPAGKSGLQRIVLKNYVLDLKEAIEKFDKDRAAERAAKS